MFDILNITCEVVKVDVSEVLVPRTLPGAKQQKIVMTRQMSMFEARKQGLWTLHEIGKFHERSHSSVLYALKTVKNDTETNRDRREIRDIIDERVVRFIKDYGWIPEPEYMDELLDGE